jgi:type II secretory pathway pseudopilin PulG
MYKNQLQELAQRSCFNLPAYACIREGPDHAPRFKATVNFNGEVFESPNYCNTLRQAEHAAAEVALNTLSRRGPSQSLAARILDETGVCKNLLQETAQRAGVALPVYATTRSGPGHLPVFTCTVEVASMTFNGESAKTKKQAEKNAAMAAWSALKQFANQGRTVPMPTETEMSDEQEQNTIARALALHYGKEMQLPQSAQNPSSGVPPIRLRAMSSREGLQPGSTLLSQSHAGSWVPDLSNDQQRHMRSQSHANVAALPTPVYRSVVPSRAGSSVLIRDVTGHRDQTGLRDANAIRDAPIAKRAVERIMGGNFVGRPPPVNLRPVPIRRERHEVAVPYADHQRDEDEWLRGDSSKSSRDAADARNDSLDKEHGSSVVHGSYNPMSWSGSAPWWGTVQAHTMQRRAAMPVVLRPAVMVCAAPPRRPASTPDDAETDGEAATRQVLSQLSL